MSGTKQTGVNGEPLLKAKVTDRLAATGYPPALAATAFAKGEYSRAVELCLKHLSEKNEGVSARLIYARALYHTSQYESAVEQFHLVLTADPDNIVALKYLGDLKFADGDNFGAIADYERIQKLDPSNESLHCCLSERSSHRGGTITLVRTAGEKEEHTAVSSRRVPFYTETLGDLYFSQGHPRLAIEVFMKLNESGDNPRLARKLSDARARVHDKEH